MMYSRNIPHVWKKAASVTAVAAATCALTLIWVHSAAAQPTAPAAPSADVVMIQPNVPGATPLPEPAPNTPVPKWAQQSYNDYLRMKASAQGGTHYTRETYAHMPDWSGVWNHIDGFAWDHTVNATAKRDEPSDLKAIFDQCASFPCKDWVTAALTPQFALRFREKLIAGANGVAWDYLSDCLPAGFPRDMLISAFQRYFIVTPERTVMYFQEDEGNRVIYTDGRGHIPPSEAYPLWTGDSIGFWDKDTLVVHTLYLRNIELNRNLPPDSEDASVVERIRMTDPNTIQDTATLYDPKMLYKPWSGVQTYKRATNRDAYVDLYSCAENNNVVQGTNGASEFLLPGQKITTKRGYTYPDQIQNVRPDVVIRYGAKLLKKEAPIGIGATTSEQPTQ